MTVSMCEPIIRGSSFIAIRPFQERAAGGAQRGVVKAGPKGPDKQMVGLGDPPGLTP